MGHNISTARVLFRRALAISMRELDDETVQQILFFSKQYLLILTVTLKDLETMITNDSYKTMLLMVQADV